MAQQLNLLPESFVFLDDNPAERALVRQSLPGTAVPELAAPESYVRTLDRAGYFEAVGLSADDKKRAQMYHENALRSAASASFADYGEYLRSLAMRAEIGPFRAGQLGRITQLINKTNQFNLTTRRYTCLLYTSRAARPCGKKGGYCKRHHRRRSKKHAGAVFVEQRHPPRLLGRAIRPVL